MVLEIKLDICFSYQTTKNLISIWRPKITLNILTWIGLKLILILKLILKFYEIVPLSVTYHNGILQYLSCVIPSVSHFYLLFILYSFFPLSPPWSFCLPWNAASPFHCTWITKSQGIGLLRWIWCHQLSYMISSMFPSKIYAVNKPVSRVLFLFIRASFISFKNLQTLYQLDPHSIHQLSLWPPLDFLQMLQICHDVHG